ncbi:MAG: tRNA (adenosine(37)-N6)-threonylcarbamoyltransferase complex ATPase subunit type 1 TsaE [Limisphaerales bacterium]
MLTSNNGFLEMPSLVSHSPADTEALGENFGRNAQRGWVIALFGDLGAGKTQFVKGLARGLGIHSRVHSPTFTLVAQYAGGRFALFHLDLYRFETPDEILAAGIEDFLDPDGVAVIEWAEKLDGLNLPAGAIKTVRIEILSQNDRRIIYDDFGA